MPVTYPPAPPKIVGDNLEIHALLKNPTLIARRIRDIAENRYISDVLLTAAIKANGGSVQYQQGESQFTDRAPEQVAPGGEYPQTGLGYGPWQTAATAKWGQDAPVSDEAIARLGIDPVNRALLKLINQNVKTVDGLSLAVVASQVTATQAATALWSADTAKILRDLMLAKAKVTALNEGFEPDLCVVDDITYAYLVSDDVVAGARAREDKSNPIYTGEFPVIGGIRILPTPNLPFANTSAFLVDSTQLGGMADEDLGGPGYQGALKGIETKSIRDEDKDRYKLRARRVTVPIVLEPMAGIRITGVRA